MISRAERDQRNFATLAADPLKAENERMREVLQRFVDECLRQDIKLGSIVGDAQDILQPVQDTDQ